MYLVRGGLLQIHYLKPDLATCFASGCSFWSSLKQRSDCRMVTACFQDVVDLKQSPYVFCEKTSMISFVDVVFCPSEKKKAA